MKKYVINLDEKQYVNTELVNDMLCQANTDEVIERLWDQFNEWGESNWSGQEIVRTDDVKKIAGCEHVTYSIVKQCFGKVNFADEEPALDTDERLYTFNRETKQYIDTNVLEHFFTAIEDDDEKYERYCERFDEYVDAEWAGAIGNTEERNRVAGFEHVTTYMVKGCFGTTNLGDVDDD